MSVSFGIIGYGEVGQTFAAELLANGAASVVVCDKIFDTPAAEARIAKAREIGVGIALSLQEVLDGADIVISAVTADQAKNVATEAAGLLKAGQLYLDVNSASPGTKIDSAASVDACGAHFVEAAVMATVPGYGLKVPILAGGARAEHAAGLLNPLGMNITPVSEDIGRASAMKLCRSIMIKGMEALIIQCKEASTRWDVEAQVFASLAKTYPGMDWPELAVKMRGRVRAHGVRRSAEMREAAEMLRALDMEDALCEAIADIQAEYAGK